MSGLGRSSQKRTGHSISTPTPVPSAGLRLREDHPLVPSPPYAALAEPISRGTLSLSLSAKYSAVRSAVEELSAARTRSTSLSLPLKAALVGIIEIAELFKGVWDTEDALGALRSKLDTFEVMVQTKMPDGTARLGAVAETVQRLWRAIEDCFAQVGQPAQSARNFGHVMTLIRCLTSLLDALETDDNRVGQALDLNRHLLQRSDGGILLPSSNMVSHTASINLNLGNGIIVNNSSVRGYISAATQAESPERANNQQIENMKLIRSILGDRIVPEAMFDTQPANVGCMPGTRESVLSKFTQWVKTDPMATFWLAGMVGTGKTSIAATLCRRFQEDPTVVLGGAFFCSRSAGSVPRSKARRILPTLVASLASQSPAFAAALVTELEADDRVAYKSASEQIVPLLAKPLATLPSSDYPIVFIIDALDECCNVIELTELLTAITSFNSKGQVKFILTSRPEMHIRGSAISNPTHNTILHLHTIREEEVKADIHRYVTGTLGAVTRGATWYTLDDVEALVDLSHELFIFASTVLLYVLDKENIKGRQERLRKMISTATATASTAASVNLDKIYEMILHEASRPDKADADELNVTCRVLAGIIAARAPLSVQALGDLLNLDADDIRGSLERLHSVVYMPHDDITTGVRVLHASFGDYMLLRAAERVRITASLGDDILARGCLDLMSKRLHFNVSQSRSSYEANPSPRSDNITLSLEYACLQWIYHISALPIPSALDEEISKRFFPYFLFWLESMSVLCQVRRGAAMLAFAATTVQLPELSRFLLDANSFVASSREAIERSAPHIYLSALPFAAKQSLIYQTFYRLYAGLISIETFGIDRHDGRLIMVLTGHEGGVNSVAYSPDNRLIVSGSDDGTTRIWDTRTSEEAMPPLRGGEGTVWSVAFAPDGRRVASSTQGGVVCIWTLLAGRMTQKRLCGHSKGVLSVAFSPNGSLLASASWDRTVRLWDVETGQEVAVLCGHTDDVNAVTFSPDGSILASGSDDQTIRLWRSDTHKPVGESLCGHRGDILSVSFSPDGRTLASGSADCSIRLWDIQTAKNIGVLLGHSNWIQSVRFSPDGRSLVSAAADHTVRLWALRGDEAEHSSVTLDGHTNWIRSLAFSHDGLNFASASDDHTVRVWDAGTGQPAIEPLLAHKSVVYSVVVSPDSSFIVSGSDDRSVRVWNARTGASILPPLLGHTRAVSSVAISNDGHLIASASHDHTVRLWNAHTGEAVCELQGHEDEVNAVAFSSDAALIASGSNDYTVRIWDVTTGHQLDIGPLRHIGGVYTVAFSPNGQVLAAGDNTGRIHLWHVDHGQPIREPLWASYWDIRHIGFSPDGMRIVSGGDDETVRVWDIITGQPILVLEDHSNWVRSVAFSPEGRFIGSGSDDGTVRLWSAATGAPVATLYGHGDPVRSVAFAPNGRFIVSCSIDMTIRVWSVDVAVSVDSETSGVRVPALVSTKVDGGWLLGRTGQLLLWVPADYRVYLEMPPCTLVIGRRRVCIMTDNVKLHAGEKWTRCLVP